MPCRVWWWARSQSRKGGPSSAGKRAVSAIMARAMASLSPRERQSAREERGRTVERRRQDSRLDGRLPASGLNESKAAVPADLVGGADAAIEVDEVGAAAQQDMLAVIHDFAGAGMLVGGGAASEVRTALEQGDLVSRLGQCASGGEPGQATANHGHSRGISGAHSLIRRHRPLQSTRSFSAMVRRTRSVKTS